MRIPFMARVTALSLAATVVLGAFGAAPLLAGQNSTQPSQTPTYSIAAPAPEVAGNTTGRAEASDAQTGFFGFLGRPVPSSVPGVPDGFGHLITPGTGTVVPGTPSEGY